MNVDLAKLDGLGQTAWLTAYCHHIAGERHGLERPVSSWLIEQAGPPPFAARIHPRTLHGVALRAKIMDTWLDDMLERQAGAGPITVLSIGAGFDSRWYGRLGKLPSLIRWIEVDRPGVLSAKSATLQGSGFHGPYAAVEQRPGDLAHAPEDLIADLDGPVVTIAEGVIDYIERTGRDRLLSALRGKLQLAGLIMDSQNAIFQKLANAKIESNTGSSAVRFAWAPRDPVAYFAAHGFTVSRSHSILPDLFRISATLTERLAVSLLPPIRHGYRIFLAV